MYRLVDMHSLRVIGLLPAILLILCPARLYAGRIEDKDGKTVIHVKVFELPDPSRREPSERAKVAVVNEFRKRFPEIFAEKYRAKYEAHPEIYGEHDWNSVSVELHQFSGIKIENLGSRVGPGNLLAVAGKVAPDIMYVNFRQSGTFIREGFLYPLDNPEDGYLTGLTEEEKTFRIHQQALPVIRQKGPDGKQHIWALPYGGLLGKVVLYRKDLFDEAGVSYPRNNWTWDDFLETCRKTADPGKDVYGVLMSRSSDEGAYWVTFLWSAGGDVLAYDSTNDSWRAVYDSHEGAVALDFYTRICTERWTDPDGVKRRGYAYRDRGFTGSQKWSRGEIAMRFAYIDEQLFTEIDPEVTGMAPVPVGPTGLRGSEINSMMMGLFSDIEEPAVRDAAWEYMKFYDCRDAVEIRTRILVEGGFGRFINPRYLEMFGYEEVIRLSPPAWSECFRIAVADGKPEPYARSCNTIYKIMAVPILRAEEMANADMLPVAEDKRLDALQSLLAESVVIGEEKLLDIVPPEILWRRRAVAVFALLCMAVGFTFLFRRVRKAFAPPKTAMRTTTRAHFRRYLAAYIILLPALLTILIWGYFPLVRGSSMAFQDYKIMTDSKWVGLDNFGEILCSATWWNTVWNSVRYSLLVIALTFLPPVMLAILLQEVPRGKIFFRTIFYLPAVITSLVTILLWKSFYGKEEHGLLNAVLLRVPAWVYIVAGLFLLVVAMAFARRLFHHGSKWSALAFVAAGVIVCYTVWDLAAPVFEHHTGPLWTGLFAAAPPSEARDWLGDSRTAMFCCVLPMVWAGIGPGCLIYLAALKSVSNDLYEVADIDGATFVDKILFVIFPMLKALLIINFVGVFIGSWKATAGILAMTDGTANTEVAGLHIFHESFYHLRFGPATAMAWVLGFLLIGFTVNQLRLLSRMEFRTVDSAKKG